MQVLVCYPMWVAMMTIAAVTRCDLLTRRQLGLSHSSCSQLVLPTKCTPLTQCGCHAGIRDERLDFVQIPQEFLIIFDF
jgi:hypothetical protein